jgi:mono/diheme cytochrome c family protein
MSTAMLGIVFVAVGLAAMFLMYHLWGYPYDKERRLSAAPRWAMWLHRLLGYAFALIYILLMVKMVPRLWEYQVEFPARTTAHIILGFTIGFLLLVKISIMRFFRHFEEWMPFLGTAIMLGTIILIGLSLPYVLQERALAQSAPGGSATSAASIARVAALLPTANLPKEASLQKLATVKALTSGRHVLLDNCVKCHDLKTILAKPRTPSGWWNTVDRMAEKPALFAPMTTEEMFEVTAYLIAITPDLQKASKAKREQQVARDEAMEEALAEEAASGAGASLPLPAPTPTPTPTPPAPPPTTPEPATPKPASQPVDLAKAKMVYEAVCSQCHDLSDVDAAPPKTAKESRAMIQRMIKENDAEISKNEIKLIAAWLDAHFVAKTH